MFILLVVISLRYVGLLPAIFKIKEVLPLPFTPVITQKEPLGIVKFISCKENCLSFLFNLALKILKAGKYSN